jgi:chitinase
LNFAFKTDLIRQLVALKSRNPNLKVMAAVGGYNPGLDGVWPSMAGNSGARNNFASNVLPFLQNNGLDGIGKNFFRIRKLMKCH